MDVDTEEMLKAMEEHKKGPREITNQDLLKVLKDIKDDVSKLRQDINDLRDVVTMQGAQLRSLIEGMYH